MNKTTENYLTLPDGRRLCYAEYGDPCGQPVFVFHGNPGSRLSWGLYPGSPFLSGVRLIAPDRSGYGYTDFHKNALEYWPDDMAELANHLKIDKFAVFGPSGGGPFALVCAWKISDRITSAGLFSSVGPNVPEAAEGAIKSLRFLWKLANPLFGLVKIQMKLMAAMAKKDPEKLANKMRDLELSEWDKVIFDRPEIRNVFKITFPEAYRQNGIGSAYDCTIPANWPIPLDQIKLKIHVWQAEPDHLAGNMSKYIAKELPNSQLICLPETGHLWIMDHMKDVLETLLSNNKNAG
jgi:pimeloyl-ACP methyl ester carboxylesterase